LRGVFTAPSALRDADAKVEVACGLLAMPADRLIV
jgi:hypothetical protein